MDPHAAPATNINTSQQPLNTPITTPENKSPKKPWVRIGIITVIICVLLIFITATLYFVTSNTKKGNTQNTTKRTNDTQAIKTYPKFKFSYVQPLLQETVSKTLPIYTIDTNNSEKAASLAAIFTLNTQPKKTDNTITFNNISETQNPSYLVFNTLNGSFEYRGLISGVSLPSGNINAAAKNFVRSLGFLDNLTECNITYKKKDAPGITFIECHRSWAALGAPLLDATGVMNISQDIKISELKEGISKSLWRDENIFNTSTNQDGVLRPNDFNTITIGINETTREIHIIDSNLKFISRANSVDILSKQKAFDLFSQNKADETLALPENNTPFVWDEIFPKGKTIIGNNTRITDLELIYAENYNDLSQKAYIPMYILRGKSTLNGKHEVSIVQLLNAASSSTQKISNENNQLQLQTFTPNTPLPQPTTKTQKPTPRSTSTPAPTPTPLPPFDCNESSTFTLNRDYSKDSVEVLLPNGQTITVIHIAITGQLGPGELRNSFWLKQNDVTIETIKKIREQFILFAKQNPGSIFSEGWYTSAYTQSVTPCYLSGLSPSVFLYSETDTKFLVTPSYTTYTDPKLLNNAWVLKTQKNNTLQFENFSKDFLYYEFNPQKVVFKKQTTGFVIQAKNLEEFVVNLSKQINLNSKETERLLFEFHHALERQNTKDTFLKISLVPKKELDAVLPLHISPNPEQIHRYHFTLEILDKKIYLQEPSVPEVKRGRSTLVELGASIQN